MKNFIVKLLPLAIPAMTFCFSASFAFADVIPPGHHTVTKCIKFNNLSEFTEEIRLVGIVTGPVVKGLEAYEIKNNECLNGGYKFNSHAVYFVKSDYFATLDLNNLAHDGDKLTDPNFILLTKKLNPAERLVRDRNPLKHETFIYALKRDLIHQYKISLVKRTRE
ncbi:MAG: hypothetical protein HYW48_04915 [Deltaproteobacteria bacterium]|nr:hypothetical protein [Deltaproteobacteria bacterium]